MSLIVTAALAREGPGISQQRDLRVSRQLASQALACIECHRQTTSGLFLDWAASAHARAGVTCHDCHISDEVGPTVSRPHFEQYEHSYLPGGIPINRLPVTAVVTPKACARCHPDQARQFSKSKHAGSLQILSSEYWNGSWSWPEIEGEAHRCADCHGTEVKFLNGAPVTGTWPNSGVGRVNPDGSRGSCTPCHTRHRFSKAEARKPEACAKCHSGPVYSQWEIYKASKHGGIYATDGGRWQWDLGPLAWQAGAGYRSPTCASCHISGVRGSLLTNHNVSARLSWELQTPLSIRPEEFSPWPASRTWLEARQEMMTVCLQCHGKGSVERHYQRLDIAVAEYNTVYFRMALLRVKDKSSVALGEEEDVASFVDLWHRHGRLARMGAAMMSPEFLWQRGFYECKKAFLKLR